MSVTIKGSKLNYKDSQGNYVGVDVVAERSTEEIVGIVRSEGVSQVNAVSSAGSTAIANIQTKEDEALAQLANAAEVRDMIAGVFNTNTAYTAGQYVIQTVTVSGSSVNKLFRFKVDHAAGAWDDSEVIEVKLADDVADLKSALLNYGVIVDLSGVTVTNNYGIRGSDGALVNTNEERYRATDYIDITSLGYDRLNVMSVFYGWIGLAFYDYRKVFISGVSGTDISSTTNSPQRITIDIPKKAAYIRFTINKNVSTDMNYYQFYGVGTIKEIEDTIHNLVALKDVSFNDSNLLFGVGATTGLAINRSTGETFSNPTTSVTDYIEVQANTQYNSYKCWYAAFYDSSKTFISNSGYTQLPFVFTTPATAKYLRLTYITTEIDDIYLGVGLDLDFIPPKGLYLKQSQIENDVPYVPGIETPNILRDKGKQEDKYINYNNGAVSSATGYIATDYILVTEGTTIYGNNIGQGCFYDASKNYMSDGKFASFTSGSMTVPSGAQSMRVTVTKENWDKAYIGTTPLTGSYVPPKQPYLPDNVMENKEINNKITAIEQQLGSSVVYVGTGEDYTSILAALKDTDPATKVIVKRGTYNIVNEYKAYYGNDFWTNYAGYSGVDDPFYRGLWIDSGRSIEFSPAATVVWDYDGTNSAVTTYFSPFATGTGAEIIGLQLSFNQYCRYAIHDDYAHGFGVNHFKDCLFIGTGRTGKVTIGAGCDGQTTYIIENCIFLGACMYDISYHNSSSIGRYRIYVTGCKGEGVCYFGKYGNSPASDPTYCIVSNCEFADIVCQVHSGTPEDNMVLVEFNNTKTGT